MARLTLDASVTLKWYLRTQDEADLPQSKALLRAILADEVELVRPIHALAEIAAVLAREKAASAQQDFADVERVFAAGTVVDSPAVYRGAMGLAQRLRHHLFDTLYHAVALEEDATLVTADERYFRTAAAEGHIVLLRDFDAPGRRTG
ncbi:MAG: type II toxin-antitoxin system VapC family toxin [Betaproteobacteria bacterium]|nr:type II toxin-antitoxin system VapC family toxin [Betaproteobacteria bacterium]